MSKLSPALKELINAPFSRPGATKAPIGISKIYERIASEAHSKKLGPRPWIVLSVRRCPTPSPLPLLLLLCAHHANSMTFLVPPVSSNIHTQLPRLPGGPPGHRLQLLRQVLPAPRPGPRGRAHPRGRPQVHLLQRHPPLDKQPRRLPGGAAPRRPRKTRDARLAAHHAREHRQEEGGRVRTLEERLRPL